MRGLLFAGRPSSLHLAGREVGQRASGRGRVEVEGAPPHAKGGAACGGGPDAPGTGSLWDRKLLGRPSYPVSVRVNVLCFGVLKDHLGQQMRGLDVPEGQTVAALLRFLEGGASNRSEVWRALAVAVNREYAGLDTVLRDGDEVALLPPVSGGAEGA